ncbi:uncharacterized protein LOC127751919 [Frankliniella occidentalis]|uniref:Uncharacterized protein LOC127751919 n=1 Tax=Frankliniella occidentalis TaxID=133901 RepID=A0A9C6XVI3_FRAOC|nr:uncharacterized protein LOC127751919 [Frankliniella occidentalis]
MTPRDILDKYPHLKTPEMMICDYLLLEDLEMDILISNFNASCTLLSRHFELSAEAELAKAEILMGLHDHFLIKSLKKKIQPMLILKDEREAAPHLTSSSIQAPFIVILVKQDFCTGVKDIRSASLMMEGRLVNSLTNPKADQVAILLLAGYYSLNVEYPKVYADFMKSVERIVVNQLDRAASRCRKASWNQFLAMLQP